MTDIPGSGDTTGNPAGNQPAFNAPADATNPNTPVTPWYGNIEDADLKGYVDNKGWKSSVEAVTSYRNLEKAFGADKAGRTVILPSKDDPAEWDGVFNKLGRPETADKYNLDEPADADKDLTKWFKDTAHKHGLTDKQAKSLFADYNGLSAQRMTQLNEQSATKIAADKETLQREWGGAHEAKMAEAVKAATTFGFTKEEIDALENTVGYAGVMKKFSAIGAALGDGKFVTTDTRGGQFGALTPAAANQRIAELRADKDFTARLIGGTDKVAQEQWDSLHRAAYGKS